ncbi:MAG: class II aldolase/adducin family protein, partial [Anaerolineales bacterium]
SPHDLLVVDLSGAVVAEGGGPWEQVSSELPMHLETYRQRPDVGAVLHAHPPYCTALTVADIPLRADVLAEVLATLGEVPTTEFAMPASGEGAATIRKWIRDHDVLLLRQHGALATGAAAEEALMRLERVEHAAKVIFLATLLGKVNTLPEAARDRLLAMYTAGKRRQ